jgi:hypothetical protein
MTNGAGCGVPPPYGKRVAVLLSALSVMVVMAVPPVMAAPDGQNSGNKASDGLDKNKGGGQEHIRNAHPDHGGGSGGDNGGGND